MKNLLLVVLLAALAVGMIGCAAGPSANCPPDPCAGPCAGPGLAIPVPAFLCRDRCAAPCPPAQMAPYYTVRGPRDFLIEDTSGCQ